jgi:RNA polymerase sigma factor (sigma-70 family)
MAAFSLRPADVLRTAKRVAVELNRRDISRQQFVRFRFDEASATEEKIFILVAAFRELTGWLISANDLFDLEPALPEGACGAFPALSPRRTLALNGCNASEAVFPESRVLQARGAFVPPEPGLPDDEQFETLYTQYGVLLRGIAMRRYGVPPDDAEALVHDAFIAYLERHTSVRDAKGWLIGTVRNACCHYWRDRKREEPLLPEHEEAIDPSAEWDIEASLDRITMAAALARLGERCRETIRRFYWQQESTKDIAMRLSTSQGNVLQLLFTCRQRIAEFLRRQAGSRP